MGDYGHVTAWGAIKAGRERQALALWADAIELYEKAKANGLIDEYETQLFQPSGGALPVGIITLWGSQDQIDAIDRNEDRMRLQTRAGLDSRRPRAVALDQRNGCARGHRHVPRGDRRPLERRLRLARDLTVDTGHQPRGSSRVAFFERVAARGCAPNKSRSKQGT